MNSLQFEPDCPKVSKKKVALVETARELFLLHGIRRVSIEQICRSAQASKRTFYKYFSDKHAVARAVLDGLFEDGIALFREIIAEQASFESKCERILLLIQTEIHAAGSAFLDELTDRQSPLEPHYNSLQQRARAMTMDFFRQAQQQGHIDASVNMDFMLFMIDRFHDLLSHPDFVAMMPDVEDRANQLTRQLFHGFSRIAPR